MRRYALIGRRLGHSWSQRWFEQLFRQLSLHDHAYLLQEMEDLGCVWQWIDDEQIAGFNVTVPYKQQIIPYLDDLDPEAAAIRAVNCVTIERGRLVGHNTDAPAFLHTLQNTGIEVQNCFVLGTGGAAQAVAYALGRMGVDVTFVSRNPHGANHISYHILSALHSTRPALLVNATPVGMYPDAERSPLPEHFSFEALNIRLVYDLIYNPSPTRLLQQAAAQGIATIDGLPMLKRQAALSWQLWQNSLALSC